jgi:hypothetical protein
MTGQTFSDFVAALGEEFVAALCPPVPVTRIAPQDGYEVWLRAFGLEPSPQLLAALSVSDLARLRAEYVRYFECAELSIEQVQEAVSRILRRWPPAQF